jgi:hypothetical protein
MSADSLVFDMSSQSEGTPSVFVKKDWLSILDNQNQSYQGNQSVIDTSQLANSNKYMNYREAYLSVPLLLTATSATLHATDAWKPATAATSADYCFGLKNWYGSIIHSFTLDYNGTTIIQQTPFVGMWNCFRLMTTLSYGDLLTQGSHMGFYPDTSTSWSLSQTAGLSGIGITNNQNAANPLIVSGAFNSFESQNVGLVKRQMNICYDADGLSAPAASAFSVLLTKNNAAQAYKSYILTKQDSTAAVYGVFQQAIMATIHLKHIHNFFERVPLLKGVFMKMTLNLNQSSSTITTTGGTTAVATMTYTTTSPLGGVSPLMVASSITGASAINSPVFSNGSTRGLSVIGIAGEVYTLSVAVGRSCLNQAQSSIVGVAASALSGSISLYVPAYSFNPVFETSYLSSPVKRITYTDIYQYQVLNVAAGGNFNSLITNGIANIKSVLILPYFTAVASAAANTGILTSPILSPFDTAGAGTTSPLTLLTNFNIQISGQNAIYNTERYTYEQFLNQLYGQNAVNGGLTDGLTSGLIDQLAFENNYGYYYVNVGRMLPVEEAVPKSVNVIGQNLSAYAIDLFVFIEYGVEVSVDILTGARV